MCRLCTNQSYFFSVQSNMCEDCAPYLEGGFMSTIIGSALGVFIILFLLFLCLRKTRCGKIIKHFTRRLAIKVQALSLIPKIKLMIAFCASSVIKSRASSLYAPFVPMLC